MPLYMSTGHRHSLGVRIAQAFDEVVEQRAAEVGVLRQRDRSTSEASTSRLVSRCATEARNAL